MKDGTTKEFTVGPWRLRALFARDVKDLEEGANRDVWLWFFSHPDEDNWMAHGLSDEAHEGVAEFMANDCDGGLMDVFITYAGEPWDLIEIFPVAHAQTMRNLVTALDSDRLDQMRGLTRADLRAIRESEEADVQSR